VVCWCGIKNALQEEIVSENTRNRSIDKRFEGKFPSVGKSLCFLWVVGAQALARRPGMLWDVTHLDNSAEFGHYHCLFYTVFCDRIVSCVLHVCVLPIKGSIEYRSDDGINARVFLALNFEECSEQTTLVLKNLLVIVEYVSQKVINASFA